MKKQQRKIDEEKQVCERSEQIQLKSTKNEEKELNSLAIEIGQVTFKVGVPKKTIQGILKEKRQKFVKSERWVVEGSNHSHAKWRQFLGLLEKSKNKELQFYDTKISDILVIVRHINFESLTYLSLECNNITNIQSLGFLDANNLRKIDLGNNYITECRSLNKLALKNLDYLQICDNPLLQLSVGRIKCYQQKIYIRLMTHPYTKLFQNINFLAKLEKNVVSFIMSNQLKYYNGESKYGEKHIKVPSNEKIILQGKICDSLKRKFIFRKQA